MSLVIRTSATRARYSRRALLRGMGVGAAMLPMLESERVLAAGPNGAPRRVVTMGWANGVTSGYYPQSDDPTDSVCLKPLAPVKSKVTVIKGLAISSITQPFGEGQGHCSFPAMFTGTDKYYPSRGAFGQSWAWGAAGPSIDQAVSDWIAKTATVRTRVLAVAIAGGVGISYTKNASGETAETDPSRLFKNLFAGATIPQDRLDALKAQRKSILDFVSGELNGFSARMGKTDKAKITAHLDGIRTLEQELAAPTVACNAGAPMAGGDYPAKAKAFSDLIAIAFRCDITRAVSIVWAAQTGNDPQSMPFLDLSTPNNVTFGQIHNIAHQSVDGYKQKNLIDTWYISQLAYLANLLNSTSEPGGTILDNSVLVMANAMNEGNGHVVDPHHVLMVGSAGGAIRTGRVVKVGKSAGQAANVPNNRLLASIMSAFGAPGDSFGDPNYPGNLNAELLR